MKLALAKKILEDTQATLPLVYARDVQGVSLDALRKEWVNRHKQFSEASLKATWNINKNQRATIVWANIDRLNKLAHPKDGKAPIYLPPRRLRREAARIVKKDARQLEREFVQAALHADHQ